MLEAELTANRQKTTAICLLNLTATKPPMKLEDKARERTILFRTLNMPPATVRGEQKTGVIR